VPEPTQKRTRIIPQSDVPDPSDPPSRFRTRCLYASALRCGGAAVQNVGGHAVACHFWREIESAEAIRLGTAAVRRTAAAAL
jgi:hypothetical protein